MSVAPSSAPKAHPGHHATPSHARKPKPKSRRHAIPSHARHPSSTSTRVPTLKGKPISSIFTGTKLGHIDITKGGVTGKSVSKDTPSHIVTVPTGHVVHNTDYIGKGGIALHTGSTYGKLHSGSTKKTSFNPPPHEQQLASIQAQPIGSTASEVKQPSLGRNIAKQKVQKSPSGGSIKLIVPTASPSPAERPLHRLVRTPTERVSIRTTKPTNVVQLDEHGNPIRISPQQIGTIAKSVVPSATHGNTGNTVPIRQQTSLPPNVPADAKPIPGNPNEFVDSQGRHWGIFSGGNTAQEQRQNMEQARKTASTLLNTPGWQESHTPQQVQSMKNIIARNSILPNLNATNGNTGNATRAEGIPISRPTGRDTGFTTVQHAPIPPGHQGPQPVQGPANQSLIDRIINGIRNFFGGFTAPTPEPTIEEPIAGAAFSGDAFSNAQHSIDNMFAKFESKFGNISGVSARLQQAQANVDSQLSMAESRIAKLKAFRN